MNNTRRKQIQSIIDKLYDLQEELDLIRNDEQESLDNIPENLWGSDRYEKSEAAVENLDEAYDSLDSLLEYLESAQE